LYAGERLHRPALVLERDGAVEVQQRLVGPAPKRLVVERDRLAAALRFAEQRAEVEVRVGVVGSSARTRRYAASAARRSVDSSASPSANAASTASAAAAAFCAAVAVEAALQVGDAARSRARTGSP
jgi:hypothetical protein